MNIRAGERMIFVKMGEETPREDCGWLAKAVVRLRKKERVFWGFHILEHRLNRTLIP